MTKSVILSDERIADLRKRAGPEIHWCRDNCDYCDLDAALAELLSLRAKARSVDAEKEKP